MDNPKTEMVANQQETTATEPAVKKPNFIVRGARGVKNLAVKAYRSKTGKVVLVLSSAVAAACAGYKKGFEDGKNSTEVPATVTITDGDIEENPAEEPEVEETDDEMDDAEA